MSARDEARKAIEYFLEHNGNRDTLHRFVGLWPDEGADEFVDSIADDLEDIVEQAPALRAGFGKRRQSYRQFVELELPDMWMCATLLSTDEAAVSSPSLIGLRRDLLPLVDGLDRHDVERLVETRLADSAS